MGGGGCGGKGGEQRRAGQSSAEQGRAERWWAERAVRACGLGGRTELPATLAAASARPSAKASAAKATTTMATRFELPAVAPSLPTPATMIAPAAIPAVGARPPVTGSSSTRPPNMPRPAPTIMPAAAALATPTIFAGTRSGRARSSGSPPSAVATTAVQPEKATARKVGAPKASARTATASPAQMAISKAHPAGTIEGRSRSVTSSAADGVNCTSSPLLTASTAVKST